jgi:hypothetical protein
VEADRAGEPAVRLIAGRDSEQEVSIVADRCQQQPVRIAVGGRHCWRTRRQNGRQAEWPTGRMADRQNGRQAEWPTDSPDGRY